MEKKRREQLLSLIDELCQSLPEEGTSCRRCPPLKLKVQRLKRKQQSSKSKLEVLQQQLQEAKHEIQYKDKQLQSLRKDHQNLSKNLRLLQESQAQLKGQADSLKRENYQMVRKLKPLLEMQVRLQQNLKEASLFKSKLQEIQSKAESYLRQLQVQQSRQEMLREEMIQLQRRLQWLSEQNFHLKRIHFESDNKVPSAKPEEDSKLLKDQLVRIKKAKDQLTDMLFQKIEALDAIERKNAESRLMKSLVREGEHKEARPATRRQSPQGYFRQIKQIFKRK